MQQAARVSDNTTFIYPGKLIEYGKTSRGGINPKVDKTMQFVTGIFG